MTSVKFILGISELVFYTLLYWALCDKCKSVLLQHVIVSGKWREKVSLTCWYINQTTCCYVRFDVTSHKSKM